MDRWIDPLCEKAAAAGLRGRGYQYARAYRADSLAGMHVQPSPEPQVRRRRTPPARRVGVQSAVRVTDTWPDDLPITPAELRLVLALEDAALREDLEAFLRVYEAARYAGEALSEADAQRWRRAHRGLIRRVVRALRAEAKAEG